MGNQPSSGSGAPPQQQPHPQQQPPPQQQQTPQQAARAEAKARAKAEARAQAAAQPRPKPPKGPCGAPTAEPGGGQVVALPLATALQKRCPPWNTGNPPKEFCQLIPGYDALRVFYPAGSSTPSSGRRGGVQLRGCPPGLPARDALLRFDFMTAPTFEWTRGGKLGGGLHIGRGNAAGYLHSGTAASARLTWGPDGFLMLYIYTMEGAQQDPSYATVTKLGAGCGDHMFPGTFQVQRGVWNRITLRVRLNTPGRADGVAGLGVNGDYREFDKMVWRLHPDTCITEVMLNTFFGGSWSTPVDTSIDFANFSLTILER